MKESYTYRVAWSEEDDEYVATCPAFPLLSALAPTPGQALDELQGVVETVLQIYEEDGVEPPSDP